ncbi:DUF4386 domain-containing protein [Frateuria sp. MAH-13]|uniref:DUF4386 domain-containing protein n=1 Tax=Frateuria flava TaxID=2821489 RepID=A0ABS4DRI0_9GAMM|nr:DUF4386 domain-containing protein [Frateuria flava]MBP1475665.1 DUF4386 domain-containing protein [Frateuria flava]
MKGNARVAGLLYLITVVTGMFYLGYVPSQLATDGDAAAKVARIVQMDTLFRLGIVAELACQAAFLLLPLALYRLLGGAGRTAAVLMVAFAAASVPVALANLGHRLDVLSLLDNADYRQMFDTGQLQGQVMVQLGAYRQGLLMLEVFWGAWLLPLGYLVSKCGLLPRLLGMLLILGGLGYLADFLATLMLPSYAVSAVADYVLLPASVGELGTCLWLLAGASAIRNHGALSIQPQGGT